MEPQPVRKPPMPGYPTQREAAEDQLFLSRHMPPLWRFTGAASIALALGFAGLSAEPAAPKDTPVAQGQEKAGMAGLLVAPIFVHGEGRGAIGCVAVNPPVFMSEDEAMTVIKEELAKHGVRLSKQQVPFPEVVIPKRVASWRQVEGQFREEIKESKAEGKALVLGGLDDEKKIAVEYVEQRNYVGLGGTASTSTVSSYDMVGVARAVASQVSKDARQPIKLGVFYDPLSRYERGSISEEEWKRNYEAAWKKAQAASLIKSKELLRQQVNDFVNWLKEQKAL